MRRTPRIVSRLVRGLADAPPHSGDIISVVHSLQKNVHQFKIGKIPKPQLPLCENAHSRAGLFTYSSHAGGTIDRLIHWYNQANAVTLTEVSTTAELSIGTGCVQVTVPSDDILPPSSGVTMSVEYLNGLPQLSLYISTSTHLFRTVFGFSQDEDNASLFGLAETGHTLFCCAHPMPPHVGVSCWTVVDCHFVVYGTNSGKLHIVNFPDRLDERISELEISESGVMSRLFRTKVPTSYRIISLSPHPIIPAVLVSLCSDGMLRLWSIPKQTCILSVPLSPSFSAAQVSQWLLTLIPHPETDCKECIYVAVLTLQSQYMVHVLKLEYTTGNFIIRTATKEFLLPQSELESGATISSICVDSDGHILLLQTAERYCSLLSSSTTIYSNTTHMRQWEIISIPTPSSNCVVPESSFDMQDVMMDAIFTDESVFSKDALQCTLQHIGATLEPNLTDKVSLQQTCISAVQKSVACKPCLSTESGGNLISTWVSFYKDYITYWWKLNTPSTIFNTPIGTVLSSTELSSLLWVGTQLGSVYQRCANFSLSSARIVEALPSDASKLICCGLLLEQELGVENISGIDYEIQHGHQLEHLSSSFIRKLFIESPGNDGEVPALSKLPLIVQSIADLKSAIDAVIGSIKQLFESWELSPVGKPPTDIPHFSTAFRRNVWAQLQQQCIDHYFVARNLMLFCAYTSIHKMSMPSLTSHIMEEIRMRVPLVHSTVISLALVLWIISSPATPLSVKKLPALPMKRLLYVYSEQLPLFLAYNPQADFTENVSNCLKALASKLWPTPENCINFCNFLGTNQLHLERQHFTSMALNHTRVESSFGACINFLKICLAESLLFLGQFEKAFTIFCEVPRNPAVLETSVIQWIGGMTDPNSLVSSFFVKCLELFRGCRQYDLAIRCAREGLRLLKGMPGTGVAQQTLSMEIYADSFQIQDYKSAYDALMFCPFQSYEDKASAYRDYTHRCCIAGQINFVVDVPFTPKALIIVRGFLKKSAREQKIILPLLSTPKQTQPVDFYLVLYAFLVFNNQGRRAAYFMIEYTWRIMKELPLTLGSASARDAALQKALILLRQIHPSYQWVKEPFSPNMLRLSDIERQWVLAHAQVVALSNSSVCIVDTPEAVIESLSTLGFFNTALSVSKHYNWIGINSVFKYWGDLYVACLRVKEDDPETLSKLAAFKKDFRISATLSSTHKADIGCVGKSFSGSDSNSVWQYLSHNLDLCDTQLNNYEAHSNIAELFIKKKITIPSNLKLWFKRNKPERLVRLYLRYDRFDDLLYSALHLIGSMEGNLQQEQIPHIWSVLLQVCEKIPNRASSESEQILIETFNSRLGRFCNTIGNLS